MTTEPPFDHPDDHTKYGPPPEPPRALPWMFTPGFKSSCALICVALMLTCCLSSTVTAFVGELMHHLQSIDQHVGDISKKLEKLESIDRHVDEVGKKVDNVTIRAKEEPKKEDANKKDDAKKDK
jgi:hypothetical protein